MPGCGEEQVWHDRRATTCTDANAGLRGNARDVAQFVPQRQRWFQWSALLQLSEASDNRIREKEKNDDRVLSVLPPVGALTLLQDPARGLRSWNLSRGAARLTRACC
jgi:hypothetical protein